MSEYIEIPIETDPDALAIEAFDYLQTEFPEWLPNDGNLDTVMIEAMARMTAEARDVASAVPTDIFRYYGTMIGVTPQEAAFAESTTTWTMIDDKGYTIPAGTQVGIEITGDETIPFQVVEEMVLPPGFTVLNDVPIQAMEAGEDSSELSGTVTLIDTLDFVLSVVLDAPTSGGIDEEDDDDYLNRLTQRLELLTPRPILPQDFAVLATDIQGVERAVAVDGYNPTNDTYNNERMVTVAVVDEDGLALSPGKMTEVDDYLEDLREVNFVVHVIAPTYTTIDVQFTFKPSPGADPNTTKTEAEQAVKDYLSPANWGFSGEAGDTTTEWVNVTTVRYLELTTVINNVEGVDYVVSLTMRKPPSAYATTDIPLATAGDPVGMPQAGAVVGTPA